VRRHQDQVRLLLLCSLEDLRRRVAIEEDTLDFPIFELHFEEVSQPILQLGVYGVFE